MDLFKLPSGMATGIAVALLSGAPSASAQNEAMIVTAIEDASFVPLDPARPDGHQMAVLRGDPATGPSTMLLKLKRLDGRMHIHTADYHLAVISGEMKHWSKDESEAAAKVMTAGSYWFQPANGPHADSCLSEECLMFLHFMGPRDAIAVD